MAGRLALAFALALVTTQPVLAQSPEAPTATFMQSSKVEVVEEKIDLLEMAIKAGGRTIFYEAGNKNLVPLKDRCNFGRFDG